MTHTISSSHHARSFPPRTALPLATFFAVFLFGILFANLKWSDEVFWLGFQTENSLRQFETAALSISGFFLFFLKNRLPWWILPAVAGSLRKRSCLFLAMFAAWLGFAFGFFFTTVIRRFGIFSFPLLLGMLFPQMLFYALSYGLLLKRSACHANSKNTVGRCESRTDLHSHPMSAKLPVLLLSFGIYFAGVLCEYALNPCFLDYLGNLLQ